MGNYFDLIAAINAAIKTNGEQGITGASLNSILRDMVAALGAGYQYVGVVTPDAAAPSTDYNAVYLGLTAGTYTNFGGTQVRGGQFGVFTFNGSWTYNVADIASGGYVRYDVPQVMTQEQAAQARFNIAAASNADVNAKYTKPSGGIPATDLASAVQTSLGKADSALPASDVVDNLTTEDATKALSAKQGKVMDGKINQLGQDIGPEIATVPTVQNVTISSLGKWAAVGNALAVLFPLNGSGIVSYTAKTGVSHNVKLLSSNEIVVGQDAPIVATVSVNGTAYDSTSKYLYIQLFQSTDRTPAAVYVDNCNILDNIRQNIKTAYKYITEFNSFMSGGVTWERRTKAGEFGVLISATSRVPLEFDSNNKTLTIRNSSRVIVGRKQIALNPYGNNLTIDISSAQYGVLALDVTATYMNTSSLHVFSALTSSGLTPLLAEENYIILCAWQNYGKIVNAACSYIIDGNEQGINCIDYNDFLTVSPSFELIPLPSGMTWWSDFIIITINGVEEMWFFSESNNDHSVMNGKVHRVKMSDWSYIGSFTHNLGHCNTCQYDADSDALLISNLPGHSSHPSALYIFYNVSSWAQETSVDFNTLNPTIIDLIPIGCFGGGNNAAVWGEGNGFNRRNIVYVMSAHTIGKLVKIVLGMGSNVLDYGTFDSEHASANQYNGTYNILLGPIDYSQPADWDTNKQVIQGADYTHGHIITTNGHDQLLGFIYNIYTNKIQRTIIENVPLKGDGSIDYSVAEGICANGDTVYHGCIKISNDFRQSYSVEGYYLAKYPLPLN